MGKGMPCPYFVVHKQACSDVYYLVLGILRTNGSSLLSEAGKPRLSLCNYLYGTFDSRDFPVVIFINGGINHGRDAAPNLGGSQPVIPECPLLKLALECFNRVTCRDKHYRVSPNCHTRMPLVGNIFILDSQ